MTDNVVRERKAKTAPKNDKNDQKKETSDAPPAKKGRSCLQRLVIAILLAIAISFVLTGTFFYGFQLPSMDKVKHILVISDTIN
jgi:hypothetical protein